MQARLRLGFGWTHILGRPEYCVLRDIIACRFRWRWNFLSVFKGDVFHCSWLNSGRRTYKPKGRKVPTSRAYGRKLIKYLNSDDYRVYVGNFDREGLNVNNDHPSNDDNDNLRVCLLRNFHLPKSPPLGGFFFCWFQPAAEHPAYFVNINLKW